MENLAEYFQQLNLAELKQEPTYVEKLVNVTKYLMNENYKLKQQIEHLKKMEKLKEPTIPIWIT